MLWRVRHESGRSHVHYKRSRFSRIEEWCGLRCDWRHVGTSAEQKHHHSWTNWESVSCLNVRKSRIVDRNKTLCKWMHLFSQILKIWEKKCFHWQKTFNFFKVIYLEYRPWLAWSANTACLSWPLTSELSTNDSAAGLVGDVWLDFDWKYFKLFEKCLKNFWTIVLYK